MNIPLDETDVQRWLYNRVGTDDFPMGLYAEAMHEGENLVYQPHSNFREVGTEQYVAQMLITSRMLMRKL